MFQILQHPVSHSRRFTSRVQAPDVWVYWNSDGRDDIAKVRNLSLGGLFLETVTSKNVDSTVALDFLVQEGQISIDAVVRRAEPSRGLALKFSQMTEANRARSEERRVGKRRVSPWTGA